MEILLSPAKINLGLWITEKRPDGYHNIYTYMHKVSLYDRIFVKPSPILKVSSSNPSVPEGKENIVYKAVKEFENYTGLEVNLEIFIEKNIPVGAGLGGGSSNAATILKYINDKFGKPLSEEELIKLGASIGSDIPFFFKEGLVKVTGKGDILEDTDIKYENPVFIIYPNIPSDTKDIYSKVDYKMLTKLEDLAKIDSLIFDVNKLVENIENTLGIIAKEHIGTIREVLNTVEYLGYIGNITGSGSAVYVIGEPGNEVDIICKAKNWKLFKVKFI
ncbi:4-(cytidine 5'-diphospho)-2-C-methyl-D-erythritol kinase [Hydrogenothermus marinus]|uniref:4-diphosphocytidyl-2-C-methyl-D-erythritol kinase n=1 Tax=Hydrogenothermus marinus TaxID=133270 RepID=A0A3M0C3L4_9AQUI|nr:4-(cytidine 5'-diphospho)-2-C-methyl-D-erythritol kinase [Hydrogenothermus marinus]RMA97552.1 4-diphosphocytidyl-2-C-methyl-D-erythritol kinase [Hydrogenothermus marinus]